MPEDAVWNLADDENDASTYELEARDEAYLIRIGKQFVRVKATEAEGGIQIPGGDDDAFRISTADSDRDA